MYSPSTEEGDIIPAQNNLRLTPYWTYALAIAICAFVTYYLTAFRTITWWENSESIIVAVTGGVAHPPGALIPTLLGWIITKVAFWVSNAFALNLFAGAVSVACLVILFYACKRILELSKISNSKFMTQWPMAIGISVGILTLAFSQTIWQFSTKFTPYIFTACMTAAILLAFLSWWRLAESENSYRWLFVTTLLLGLDFSIHRTNILLWPALPILVLLRNKRAFISAKAWLAGIIGLILGLAFHLLIIPLAAMRPFLNAADPSNLSRFWDYVSLKQYGGGWLINLFPRKAAFWNVQVMDYLRVFAANFFSAAGHLGILGLLPAIAGLAGIVILWHRNWRLAFGLVILFLFASLGAIIYFNLPENYFRQIDRHYMPSFVIFGVWISIGLAFLLDILRRSFQNPVLPSIMTFLIILLFPGFQILKNYHQNDGSRSFFALDFARNIMNTLPDKAIIFTNGDNDTFPLWYLQAVEKFRPDVTVINISLLNTPWYVSQLVNRNPDLPLALTSKEIDNLSVRPWPDTTVMLSAQCDPMAFNIDSGDIADSISFHILPTIAGKYILPQDLLMLQMIKINSWRRPIYFAITVAPQNMSWLNDYLRPEGLAQRLIPAISPKLNSSILSNNLFEKYNYRGYADNYIVIDDFSRMIAFNYYAAAMEGASTESNNGNIQNCKNIMQALLTRLPQNRLEPLPPDLRQGLSAICISNDSK